MEYYIEKVTKKDGNSSVVLVDEKLKIVEPVAIYLDYLETKGLAPNTIKKYCENLKVYFTWLRLKKLNFHEVGKRDTVDFIKYLKLTRSRNEQSISAKTINNYLTSIGSFYKYYEQMGGYLENPVLTSYKEKNIYVKNHKIQKNQMNINFFKQKERKKQSLKRLYRNEIDILYEAIGSLSKDEDLNKRNQLLFKFLYETGCRIGETLGLRIADFSEPSPIEEIGVVSITEYHPLYHEDHKIKTNERNIPVGMDLIYELDDYLCSVRPQRANIDTLFVNHGRVTPGKFMTRRGANETFRNLVEVTGIECTPHDLRHTHGSELREAGYSETYIMNRMGHNSVESTHQYIHLSFETQLESYEKFLESRR